MKLRLGISPCPNDTFAFHAIMERRIDLRGLDLDIELLDVQALNDGLVANALDISKASYHAALLLADRYGLLRAGSALGFGVGPLLVAAEPGVRLTAGSRILCPGPTTTATLLFRCLHPGMDRVEHRVFSEITRSLRNREAEFGVLIHEGRFTYQGDGLHLVEDLGDSFERLAAAPVPLGGILAGLHLPDGVAARFTAVLRDSIAYAQDHRDEALTTIVRHAQELDEAVIWPYVELYVNRYTVDFGNDGERAVRVLQQQAERAGILPAGLPALQILGEPAVARATSLG
ncbi:MAG: menaquinone biosynthesis family protein [Gaiellales bacterium]